MCGHGLGRSGHILELQDQKLRQVEKARAAVHTGHGGLAQSDGRMFHKNEIEEHLGGRMSST